jgi:hypothetical protein
MKARGVLIKIDRGVIIMCALLSHPLITQDMNASFLRNTEITMACLIACQIKQPIKWTLSLDHYSVRMPQLCLFSKSQTIVEGKRTFLLQKHQENTRFSRILNSFSWEAWETAKKGRSKQIVNITRLDNSKRRINMACLFRLHSLNHLWTWTRK